MSNLKLSDGTTLVCEGVYGIPVIYQGVQRDSLTFAFDPEAVTVDRLLELFTAENCEALILEDGAEIHVHEHYTIRAGAGVSCRDLAQRGVSGGPIQDTRSTAWVTMVQSTLEERTLQDQQAAINALVVAALEV